jgi:hypothetical protein
MTTRAWFIYRLYRSTGLPHHFESMCPPPSLAYATIGHPKNMPRVVRHQRTVIQSNPSFILHVSSFPTFGDSPIHLSLPLLWAKLVSTGYGQPAKYCYVFIFRLDRCQSSAPHGIFLNRGYPMMKRTAATLYHGRRPIYYQKHISSILGVLLLVFRHTRLIQSMFSLVLQIRKMMQGPCRLSYRWMDYGSILWCGMRSTWALE